jgi:hypothetical protein
MEDRAGFIEILKGKICLGLVGQQYFWNGELVNDCGLLFLQISEDVWVRFFFDAGVFFWRIEAQSEVAQFDGEYEWQLKYLGSKCKVLGRRIEAVGFEGNEGGQINQLSIHFAPNVVLCLRNVDDRSQFSCEGYAA